MLLNEVDKLLVVDVPGAHYDHILTEIVPLMEVCDHIASDFTDVVDITKNGLTHHMVLEYIEVNVLHKGLLGIFIGCLQLLPYRVLLEFQKMAIVYTITEHVAHDLD